MKEILSKNKKANKNKLNLLIIGKEIDKTATIQCIAVPITSQPTCTLLQQTKIEEKEDSMMKEQIKVMENNVPMLQQVHQAKGVSLATMIPIIDFAISDKFNAPTREKDVPLSSWFQM